MLQSRNRTRPGRPVFGPGGVVVEHAICSSLFITAYTIGEWISLRGSDTGGPEHYIASGPAFAVFMVDGLAWLLDADKAVSVADLHTWIWPLQLLLIVTAYLGWTWIPASALVALQAWIRRRMLSLCYSAADSPVQRRRARFHLSFWASLPTYVLAATASAYFSAALYMSYPVWAFVFRDIWETMFWRTFVSMELVLLAPVLLIVLRRAAVAAWKDLAEPRRVDNDPDDEQDSYGFIRRMKP